MKRKYPKVIISEEGEKWLDKGQMWMYRNNAVNIDETIENAKSKIRSLRKNVRTRMKISVRQS